MKRNWTTLWSCLHSGFFFSSSISSASGSYFLPVFSNGALRRPDSLHLGKRISSIQDADTYTVRVRYRSAEIVSPIESTIGWNVFSNLCLISAMNRFCTKSPSISTPNQSPAQSRYKKNNIKPSQKSYFIQSSKKVE